MVSKEELLDKTVHVSRLDWGYEEHHLAEFFEQEAGPVVKIRFAGTTTRSNRFAFVEFDSKKTAENALACSGHTLAAHRIKVTKSSSTIAQPTWSNPRYAGGAVPQAAPATTAYNPATGQFYGQEKTDYSAEWAAYYAEQERQGIEVPEEYRAAANALASKAKREAMEKSKAPAVAGVPAAAAAPTMGLLPQAPRGGPYPYPQGAPMQGWGQPMPQSGYPHMGMPMNPMMRGGMGMPGAPQPRGAPTGYGGPGFPPAFPR